jgi:hypothetical protein
MVFFQKKEILKVCQFTCGTNKTVDMLLQQYNNAYDFRLGKFMAHCIWIFISLS